MVRERVPRLSRGFTVAEAVIVTALIALVATLGMPTFLGSWRTATLRGGVHEVVAVLNAGRQLAIKENQTVCVKGGGTAGAYATRLRQLVGGCASAAFCSATVVTDCIWRGAETDRDGYTTLANGVELKTPSPDVVFTALGAAAGGTFHVCNPRHPNTRAVVTVALSGRVATRYENTPC